MNKQEIIDDFINKQKGIPSASNYSICGYKFSAAYFQKRAHELGWINGYKWGVKYETNGKKPDLPDDVEVEFIRDCMDSFNKTKVEQICWEGVGRVFPVTKFRIVDERYKPKTDHPTKTKGDWFVRGDFPPAGTKCEVLSGGKWYKTSIVGMNGKNCVYDSRDFEPYIYNGQDNPANFRPIKTEREKFIELASKVLHQTEGGVINDISLGQLFDEGFRAPK